MGVAWFIVQLVFVGLLTLFIWNKYGNWRKQHFLVSASTFIGWYFSFLIILVLPLDVAITFYHKCHLDEIRLNNHTVPNHPNITLSCEEPKGYLPDYFLLSYWRIVYWTSQLLTWVILPIMQSYSKAGEFTASGKLKSALYNNVVYYGIYAALFFFLLCYAISKGISLSLEHLKILLISASNTWGLFILVVLLGYGLVEVPRRMWLMGSRGFRLNKTYFDIEKLSTDKNDAEESIQELYNECREVLNLLKNTRGTAREKVHIIMSRFPSNITDSSNTNTTYASSSNLRNADASAVSQEMYLIRLNKRVIEVVQNHHRTQAQWRALLEKAFYLEDVEVAETSGKLPEWPRTSILSRHIPPALQFIWHITLKRPLLQTSAIFCGAMTLLIMWSECTFFIIHPQLSLAARILHSMALGYHYKYIQWCAIVLILYLGVCAYFTVFHLRIYRYYNLDSHHMTDEHSLIFSAMLLCRLTPPLCLNFLGMIHLDSHITADTDFGVETQFTKLMGHLDVVPLVASGINVYLPILIVLLCLSTWFRLGTRFLHSLGVDQFVDDDDMTSELVQSGRAIVTMERNKIHRQRDREQRRETWANKLSNVMKNQSNRDSDRLPILESQDEPLLADDRPTLPISTSARIDDQAVPDLELGGSSSTSSSSAFLIDTTPTSLLPSGRRNLRSQFDVAHHPTPGNIFDDL